MGMMPTCEAVWGFWGTRFRKCAASLLAFFSMRLMRLQPPHDFISWNSFIIWKMEIIFTISTFWNWKKKKKPQVQIPKDSECSFYVVFRGHWAVIGLPQNPPPQQGSLPLLQKTVKIWAFMHLVNYTLLHQQGKFLPPFSWCTAMPRSPGRTCLVTF